MDTTARNATLEDLVTMLREQQGRKVDIVAPAHKLHARGGNLVVTGADHQIDLDGVTEVDGIYRPTRVCDEGIAAKLGMPLAYLRKLREERLDLYEANVNGWLRGSAHYPQIVPELADTRSFMLRGFKPDDGRIGIGRALLSDRYLTIDHLDALTAAIDGINMSGHDVQIVSCDLTDRRMVVRVQADEIKALAPILLAGYRSPFSGLSGSDNPTVFAGFEIANSETGGGAYTITPRLIVEVCSNGMKMTKDAMRAVHIGSQLEEGEIKWSNSTQEKALELIRARTTDAVSTFLDINYMTKVIRRLEEKAGKPVETVDEVKVLTKGLKFTDAQTDGILGAFIKGGQMTLGGVVNAVTAYAQEVPDGDTAYDLEGAALKLLGV